ncbi:MAG: hypothetical protein DWI21_16910 [Planctomycetota bacterium]|nr:MAG: hypothetical protein DWI21_16910 [Planctomycetota bacterium]
METKAARGRKRSDQLIGIDGDTHHAHETTTSSSWTHSPAARSSGRTICFSGIGCDRDSAARRDDRHAVGLHRALAKLLSQQRHSTLAGNRGRESPGGAGS